MCRKKVCLRHGPAKAGRPYSPEEVKATLRDLCREGVLELGVSGEDVTFRVSDSFAARLNWCHFTIMAAGGYRDAPLAEVVLLAIVDWKGKIVTKDAARLAAVLEAVLRPEGT